MKKLLVAAVLVFSVVLTANASEIDVQDSGDIEVQNVHRRGGVSVGIDWGGGSIVIGPHRPHRHDYPSYRRVICYAQNRRGDTFRARGESRRWTQERALEKCYAYSRHCRPLGCELY